MGGDHAPSVASTWTETDYTESETSAFSSRLPHGQPSGQRVRAARSPTHPPNHQRGSSYAYAYGGDLGTPGERFGRAATTAVCKEGVLSGDCSLRVKGPSSARGSRKTM
jgi:hypothetical protein